MLGCLFKGLGRLPLIVLHGLGVAVGWLVYALSPAVRRMLRGNLAQAVGTVTPALLRQVVSETGKSFLETPWVWRQPPTRLVRAVVRVTGWDCVGAARAAGRGLLFVTPHLGCFEISAQYYAAVEGPMAVLFRRPRKSLLAPLMDAGRNRGALRAVPADSAGVRQLLRALRAGEAIGVLPDQVPRGSEGVWAPFFGKPAYTMTLVARLADPARVQIILTVAERLPWARGYHLHVEPLDLPAGDLTARVTALNAALERLILRCPAQYQWAYNRYKRPADLPPEQDALKDAP